ncbi:MAG: hypothetical protein JXB13_11610 [Phycisphaerae bacterium]|nr:hypothetical protein [Phycisphaerae bacterium]
MDSLKTSAEHETRVAPDVSVKQEVIHKMGFELSGILERGTPGGCFVSEHAAVDPE